MVGKKKVAAPPAGVVKQEPVNKAQENPLIEKRPRNFGIGNDIQPKRDLSRFVKWPEYIQLQRQKAILKMRLKVPPPIHQFSRVIDKNTAIQLFKLLSKYRPETKQQKKERLIAMAAATVEGKKPLESTKKPVMVKYGLNHVTALIEAKKAQFVVIANDVDPIELVLWLPALCRKMDVPYCIVSGKARLGTVVHKKTSWRTILGHFRELGPPQKTSVVAAVTSFQMMLKRGNQFLLAVSRPLKSLESQIRSSTFRKSLFTASACRRTDIDKANEVPNASQGPCPTMNDDFSSSDFALEADARNFGNLPPETSQYWHPSTGNMSGLRIRTIIENLFDADIHHSRHTGIRVFTVTEKQVRDDWEDDDVTKR